MKVTFSKYILKFNFEAKTSRGTMSQHVVYFVKIQDSDSSKVFGLGECAPLPGLSIDFLPDIETLLSNYCHIFQKNPPRSIYDIFTEIPEKYPSIRFAFETAFLDFKNGGNRVIFDNKFSQGKSPIKINGLVWMGHKAQMLKRINQKIEEGYDTIKLKIGAINFDDELDLLKTIRQSFTANDINIRLDANGAFTFKAAKEKIAQLSQFDIHSIEQPIKAGQPQEMAALCKSCDIDIALDEELIGLNGINRENLLKEIQPQYIILKPTLLGGLLATDEWIQLAEKQKIAWWITSSLESNIGLNAIAQLTANYKNLLPQGLGTGQLYTNNITSALHIEKGHLKYS